MGYIYLFICTTICWNTSKCCIFRHNSYKAQRLAVSPSKQVILQNSFLIYILIVFIKKFSSKFFYFISYLFFYFLCGIYGIAGYLVGAVAHCMPCWYYARRVRSLQSNPSPAGKHINIVTSFVTTFFQYLYLQYNYLFIYLF